MKPMKVVVVDYGMGNLFSVCRALEACGVEPVLANTPQEILDAKALLLPGVGAFADGMAGLSELGLIQPIREYAKTGRPLLGICLGMQMLLDSGEEFGIHEGLGLIPGAVRSIPSTGLDGQPHKIPHIGWNALLKTETSFWTDSILDEIEEEQRTYFVHSFTAVPTNEEHRLADCDYNGQRISAAVQSGNIYGTQFHPEKSGPVGLKILKNFLVICDN
jgi:glutamine amidotransferase